MADGRWLGHTKRTLMGLALTLIGCIPALGQGNISKNDVIRLVPLAGETESPVITALAIAPAGDWVAAAGDDHAIRLLRADGFNETAILYGHQDWVKALAFSPSGRWLASCGHDGSLRLWELAIGDQPARLLAEHRVDHALFCIAFASDSEFYAAGFSDAVYRLDIGRNELEVDHRCECRDIRAMDVSREGRHLAYGGRDGLVRVISLSRPEHALAAGPAASERKSYVSQNLHYSRIQSVRFSEDGRSVLSVGEDRRLVQWDYTAQHVVGTLDIPGGKLLAVCPLGPSQVAVSGSDNTIRVVDLRSGTVISKLIGHDGSIAILQRQGGQLFSGGFDTTVRTWNLEEAMQRTDSTGRFVHPVSAQFEDSSAQERIR